MRTIVLSGSKVALAAMTEADQLSFQQWLSGNEELRTLIDDHRIPTMEDQMNWYKRVQKPDRRFFSLVTIPKEILIGNAGFVDIEEEKKSAVLRITIGNPEFVGKGLGSEAVKLLTTYAFTQTKWNQLSLNVISTNVRAIRTYEGAGFTKKNEHLHNGKTILTMTLDCPDL
jgi:RimJ/RimL family protein N-acetyltransferase